MSTPADEELLAYADELLPVEEAVAIEMQLRKQPALRDRLDQLLTSRDQGNLSAGDIWRAHRLSCPTRTELGLYLVEANPSDLQDYIHFHVQTIGCVFCQAQLEEMRTTTQATADHSAEQRRRDSLFASSAGLLSPRKPTTDHPSS